MCLPSGKQPDAFGHQAQTEGDDEDRAGLEQIFVVPLREERPEQAEQQHEDARACAEGEHARRAACPRPGRGGEDPHRRQRAARHQAGQQPDGECLAPEAAGLGQLGADPAQKRYAPHPEPDEHHEQPADGQEHAPDLQIVADVFPKRAEDGAHQCVAQQAAAVIEQRIALCEHNAAAHADAVHAREQADDKERTEADAALRARRADETGQGGDSKIQARDKHERDPVGAPPAAAVADGVAGLGEDAPDVVRGEDVRVKVRCDGALAVAGRTGEDAARVQQPVCDLVLALRADHTVDLAVKYFMAHIFSTSMRSAIRRWSSAPSRPRQWRG